MIMIAGVDSYGKASNCTAVTLFIISSFRRGENFPKIISNICLAVIKVSSSSRKIQSISGMCERCPAVFFFSFFFLIDFPFRLVFFFMSNRKVNILSLTNLWFFMKILDKKLSRCLQNFLHRLEARFDLCSTLASGKAQQSSIIYFYTRKVPESSAISHPHKWITCSLHLRKFL